jgi:outer membrane lipoprotein-sorting protein
VLALLSDWNLSPTIPANEFTFTPPAGATRVEWRTTK